MGIKRVRLPVWSSFIVDSFVAGSSYVLDRAGDSDRKAFSWWKEIPVDGEDISLEKVEGWGSLKNMFSEWLSSCGRQLVPETLCLSCDRRLLPSFFLLDNRTGSSLIDRFANWLSDADSDSKWVLAVSSWRFSGERGREEGNSWQDSKGGSREGAVNEMLSEEFGSGAGSGESGWSTLSVWGSVFMRVSSSDSADKLSSLPHK